jgi:hypothetical protein
MQLVFITRTAIAVKKSYFLENDPSLDSLEKLECFKVTLLLVRARKVP